MEHTNKIAVIKGLNSKPYIIASPRSQNGLKRDIIDLVLNLAAPDSGCALSDFLHALQYVLDKYLNMIPTYRKLPEDGDEVIAAYLDKARGYEVLMYNSPEHKTIQLDRCWFNHATGDWISDSEITHWAPIPEMI